MFGLGLVPLPTFLGDDEIKGLFFLFSEQVFADTGDPTLVNDNPSAESGAGCSLAVLRSRGILIVNPASAILA